MKKIHARMMSLFVTLMLMLTMWSVPALAVDVADGTYTGKGAGMGGAVEVAVTVADGKITGIEVTGHQETPGISDAAITGVPAAIIEAQSVQVDGVTGATLTSNAIKEAVAFALSGSKSEAADGFELTVKPDVVVIGGGMGGMASAVRAAELGANVVLFEQSARLGGCGYLAGGSLSGAGYNIQKAAGIEDTPEKFFADFVSMGGDIDLLNEAIARKHAEVSGPVIDWVQDYVGAQMSDVVDDGSYIPMNTKRVTYSAGGSAAGNAKFFVEALEKKLNEFVAAGAAQVVLNTRVSDIVLGDAGDVVGVVAGGQEVAAASTIIATGGYGYSEKWLKEFAFDNVTSSAVNTATGDGYDFARKAGGVFDNMDYCAAYAGAIPVTGFAASLRANVMYEGAIWVNNQGARIINEPAADSGGRNDAWRLSDKNEVYVVFSEGMLTDKPVFSGMLGSTQTYDNKETLSDLIEKGLAFKADSIAELSEKTQMPLLQETLETYNADVAAGLDSQFGRTDSLIAFEGPLYAVYTVPYILMTQGGPRIDADGQLVREDGSKVGNVYLAGEIVGSANVAGHSTIGGIGNGLCMTWGYISATSAVANAGK